LKHDQQLNPCVVNRTECTRGIVSREAVTLPSVAVAATTPGPEPTARRKVESIPLRVEYSGEAQG